MWTGQDTTDVDWTRHDWCGLDKTRLVYVLDFNKTRL